MGSAHSEPITPAEAVKAALAGNRLIKIASLDVDKGRSAAAQVKTRLLPQADLTLDEGELLSPLKLRIPQGSLGSVPGLGAFPVDDVDIKTNPRLTTLATLTLAQPLTQIPRIRLGAALAREQTALLQEVLRQRELETADSVRSACYDLSMAQAARKAASAAVALAGEAVQAAEAAVKSGALLDQGLLEARAKRAAAVQQEQLCGNAVISARMKLNQLMARPLGDPLEMDVSGDILPPLPSREEAVKEAAARRPEVVQAEKRMNMAGLALRIRRREDEPDLSLVLSAAKTYSLDVLPDPVVMLGLRMTWQPVDWGRKKEDLKAKSADLREAELGLEEARTLAALDADVKYRAVEDCQGAVESASASLAAAREKQRVVVERLKAGAALEKDRLEASFAAAQAEAVLAEAQGKLAKAHSALLRAMGRL